MAHALAAWAVAACVLASAALGSAQDAGGPAVERVPPRLIEHVGAEHPEGLEDRDAVVVLELVVAGDGTVRDVTVVESAGAGLEPFDARAAEAARAFRFEPARIGGEPVAARIRYRYVFEHTIVADPEPAVDPQGDPETDAEADVVDPDAEDDTGVLNDDTGGTETAPGPTFRARAEVEGPPRDATRRVLRRDVLTSMPGTRGDALRAVELLPGVGRPAFGGGVLLVRGAAPGDSQVFLDGNPVPLLYHFGGLTSFFHSQLLDRIEFVPGNFSVRYGRKIGGILEVDPRDPRTDGYHGMIDVSAIDASIVLEGPIGDDFALALAFRRSLIDVVLGLAQQGPNAPAFLTAPVYYDYQAIATWTPSDRDRIRFLLYGSTDELLLLLRDPSDTDFAIRGNLGVSTQFHRLQMSWRHVESILEQDVQIGIGLDLTRFSLGDALSLDSELVPVNLRAEWRLQLAPTVRTIVGIDAQIMPLDLTFRGPRPMQSEGMPSSGMLGAPSDFSTGLVTSFRPAVYLETDVRPVDVLDLALGVRADYYAENDSFTVDPRLVARLRVAEPFTLRTGVGLFSQPPELQELAPDLGNPDLDDVHAIHVGLGGDLRISELDLSFTLDGFYKHVWDRVIGTPRGEAPRFVNGGLGRIYGMEVGARVEPDSVLPLYGFLSYTLMRSERQDGPGAEWRLFDFDQTHILTLALVAQLGRGWELGATFRLVSGNPTTPVIGSILDVRTGTYAPIYGAVNSDRNPFFHRLDARLSKLWQIGDVRLTLSIDIQNVYNSTNREGVIYNYDYSQSVDLPGLPILPSIGLRGEL